MSLHLTKHRGEFGPGRTPITTPNDPEHNTGIGLSVLKLEGKSRVELTAERETAWLLMDGSVSVQVGPDRASWARGSLFDDLPGCLHVSAGTPVVIECESATEFTVYETLNEARFEPRLYGPDQVRNEHRGQGQVRNACYRFVRTIFDRSNAPEQAELVLGEVITMPGRWSSYPPHHHPQPEIYHYRFTDPKGYGHAELGEEVLKVRHNDTVKIFHPNDHSQVAAPGYGMYYSWVIRNLPGQPYGVPDFDPEHTWLMKDGAEFWWPEGVD